jgi:hypothetical protein
MEMEKEECWQKLKNSFFSIYEKPLPLTIYFSGGACGRAGGAINCYVMCIRGGINN